MLRRKRDFRRCTYCQSQAAPEGPLFQYLGKLSPDNLLPSANQIAALTDLFLEHRFDLLGSGWVQVKHDMVCHGVEGHRYEMGSIGPIDAEGHWLEGRINSSNLSEAQRIWSLTDKNYVPIDWHLDFKSGYRWCEATWYLDVPYGHRPGLDIKVPWELARMQHLPQFAFAYGLSRCGQTGFALPEIYVREFRNQVLDFMATNPPRFGVNWACTMDVGIRVANWLVAYDLFRSYGIAFDDAFEAEFRRSVYEHGNHITHNLEWAQDGRGNHYLADIVGLLFVAAFLPTTKETAAWLAFAIRELVREVEYQFTPEGSNFEGSTSYHRLAAEMVVYATALVLGLPAEKKAVWSAISPQPSYRPGGGNVFPLALYPLDGKGALSPFPPWYIERLEKMGEFTRSLIKPDGSVPQIGDNDSGRFLKLQPDYHTMKVSEAKAGSYTLRDCINLPDDSIYWDENHLDHRHLPAVTNAVFEGYDIAPHRCGGGVEAGLVSELTKGVRFPFHKKRDEMTAVKGSTALVVSRPPQEGVRLHAFAEFGLYLYRSEDIYLLIRCGSIGQGGRGGHAHNDNLSFELNVRGRDFLIDGGSYLYTPFPRIRNDFRSTRVHNTLAWGQREQNTWDEGLTGLFWMRNQARARITHCGSDGLSGEHFGFGIKHNRSFKPETSSILVEDVFGTDSFGEINFNLSPEVEIIQVTENGFGEYVLKLKNEDVPLKISLRGVLTAVVLEGFFSQGYGKRMRNHLVRCLRAKRETEIEVDMTMER